MLIKSMGLINPKYKKEIFFVEINRLSMKLRNINLGAQEWLVQRIIVEHLLLECVY